MLSKEENDLLTRVGPGTPCGELMRRYWQPAALSEELPPGGPPLSVRLLGEDLVLYRDAAGRPGLLGIHCAHRGADLSYGRLEDGGIRCIYHGWLYDIHGNCLEQPGEPAMRWRQSGSRNSIHSPTSDAHAEAASTSHARIHQRAYPCREAGGMVLAYLGSGDPPLLPKYEFLTLPEEHVYAVKLFSSCNYLQGNEGNIDLLHVSFLHHSERDVQELGADGPTPDGKGLRDNLRTLSGRGAAPFIETCEAQLTDVGLRICKVRDIGPEENYIRVATFILPNLTAVPGGQTNWHVPIDDTHHWKYTIIFNRQRPLDKERVSRRHTMTADYTPIANRENRYLQDRESMKYVSYSGISPSYFQQQDLCATEGAGRIQDRTQEHLVATDAPIVAARRILASAIKEVQNGRDPPHVVREPGQNRFPNIVATFGTIPKSTTWKEHCNQLASEGRGWQTRMS
ncbi:MAG: Rieske 2Fe-2S domain-containing protein [Chloroflexi bacterium]|nr:Rieske 2Fe-2S domain-containing protein [Chloroflexota bacterium]